jgi:twitching motility protein PilI
MKSTTIAAGDGISMISEQPEDGTDQALPSMKEKYMFGIRIGRTGFVVSPSNLGFIINKALITPLPNAAPWLSGVLSLRGNLVPVIDLHVILSEEVINEKNRLLFVMVEDGYSAAIWIDDLPVFKSSWQFQTTRNHSALSKILQRFVPSACEQDGQLWYNINFSDLFDALGCRQYCKTASTINHFFSRQEKPHRH